MGKNFFVGFFFSLGIFLQGQTDTSLTFSEIMFYPNGNNNEFIEIYNLSNIDSIDLSGFKIIYSTYSPDLIEPMGTSILPPQSFAIIFEGDYDSISGIYNSMIPNNAIWFKINNSAFGASGMANTSDRNLYLINKTDDTIDVCTYSANNSIGISDEKILLSKNNFVQNWLNSHCTNGTPGKYNSVSPKENNISISTITFTPDYLKLYDTLHIKAVIKNKGLNDQNNFFVQFFNDVNKDSLLSFDEIINTKFIPSLLSYDSVEVQFDFVADEAKQFILGISIPILSDEDTTDNKKFFEIFVMPADFHFNDLVINEIMYSPINDEPEWIEIFNRTDNSIDLTNWTIKDKSTNVKLSNKSIYLASGDYLIISRDTSITNYYKTIKNLLVTNLPTLNNLGDEIVLLDANNNLIDSLAYNQNWGGKNGVSLERIDVNSASTDSTNWTSSVSINKATPCSINSVAIHTKDLIIYSISEPQKYYQFGDEISFSVKIKNIGTTTINSFSILTHLDINNNGMIDINEERSRQFYLLNNYLTKDDTTSVELKFTNYLLGENNLILQLVIDEEEYSENNLSFIKINVIEINVFRNDIVINEIMYSPSSNQPEWIEIYNQSNKQINLKNFTLADKSIKNTIEVNNFFINPYEYLVIAKDSTIISHFEIDKLIVSNFPSLNNLEDNIVLLDSLNRVIDSVYYFSSWGGNTGKSLERIDVEKASNEKNNWGSCIDSMNATPGKQNSIAIKNYDVELTSLNISPERPSPKSELVFNVLLKNIGKKPLTFYVNLYEKTINDSTQKTFLAKSDLITISTGDSINYEFSFNKTILGQPLKLFAEIVSEQDEQLGNNNYEKIIFPSFDFGSLIVNEIMFNPINGEPEWFEIFNNSEFDINLLLFSVFDVLTTPSKNIITDKSLTINSGKFIVISKDSSIYFYHNKINSTVIVSKFPNLNNDSDGIIIRDYYGSKIDSVFYNYNWGGNNGHSLERISVYKNSTDSNNWASSNDFELSTPGRINSVSKKKNDLALDNIAIFPSPPKINDEIYFSAVIKNIGELNGENFTVSFQIIDAVSSQTFYSEIIKTLSPNDSILVVTSPIKLFNNSSIIVKCLYEYDEDLSNNVDSIKVFLSSMFASVLISEFFPYPNVGLSEWIEFFNNSGNTIDISNWKIVDVLPDQISYKIEGQNLIVNPYEYFVISSDTNTIPKGIKKFQVNFGNLGNSEDGIILLDANDLIIDSIYYSKNITIKKGKSIERKINSDSNQKNFFHYSLSPSGNTVGRKNSIEKNVSNQQASLVFNEIMFDPSIDNSEFIEFYNNTKDSINIGGWILKDNNNNFLDIAESDMTIPPGNYFVISSDSLILAHYLNIDSSKLNIPSNWISLTNDKKSLMLCNIFDEKIDSILYESNWHNPSFRSTKNISLERINPTLNSNDKNNWSSSVSPWGATPCQENSIFIVADEPTRKLSIEPNPFSPDNDGFEDFTIISIKTKSNGNQLRLRIFDDKGRLKRNLIDNLPMSNSIQIIFDGRDNDGKILNVGMYIVLVEIFNSLNKIIDKMKSVIVVAQKL